MHKLKIKKTETVKGIWNCDMCKTNIEKAGNIKKTSEVIWDKDSRMATITMMLLKPIQTKF
jgi:ribosomal protein L37AE/L43A